MSYQDTDVENDINYHYLIRTVVASGQKEYESENDIWVSGAATDTLPPDPPDNVTVRSLSDLGLEALQERNLDGIDGIEVSWINPADSDFAFVRIYRSEERGELGMLVYDDVGVELVNSPIRYYIDVVDNKDASMIDLNTSYYFTVTSVDASGNESTKDMLASPFRGNPFGPSF